MIRLFGIGFILFFTFLLSCKKDIGNYTYIDTETVVIDTTGLGGTYRQLRLSNLHIAPAIHIPEGHEADYQWLIYRRQTTTGEVPPAREISNKPVLDVLLEDPVGSYTVELIITDRSNNLKTNVLFDVTITANMEYGMLILYQSGEGGDVDFIRTPALSSDISETTQQKKLFSGTMGHLLPGQARFIWSARQSYQISNWITVGSDTYVARFNGSDFTHIRNQQQMFNRSGIIISPEAYVFTTSSYQLMVNSGKLMITSTGFFESDAKFTGPIDGDYELAPYLTPKISYPFYAIGYDQKNGRFINYFLNLNEIGDFDIPIAGQAFDPRNIGKHMLYMTSGVSNHTFSFFKDKTGNGRWMYVSNFSGTARTDSTAIARYEMTQLPDIVNARQYQVSGFGSYAYYATASNIYNYAYRSSNTASVAFEVPAGEQITCMRYYRPVPNTSVSDKEERVLYVATWDGTVGRVYELAINETSGTINQTPLNVFEIDGEVIDMASRAQGAG